MADTKITALAAISTVDPAADVLPIVDISDTSMAASGTTKKVTVNQILGAGGTATLASATITGDLTVRTNKLLVTSTGVGVGMTPVTPLSGVIGTTGAVFFRTTDPSAPVASPYIQAPVSSGFSSTAAVYGFWYQGSGIGSPALNNVSIITDSAERYKIDATGISTWSVAGTTAMTLDSTGLGVGVTPSGSGGCLQLKSGITFPATQVASSDANTLDDYEEGTFVPTQGAGLTVVGAFSSSGTYTKVGRLVTITGILNGSTSIATAAVGLMCSGLPFSALVQVVGGAVNQTTTASADCVVNNLDLYSVTAISAANSIRFSATYPV